MKHSNTIIQEMFRDSQANGNISLAGIFAPGPLTELACELASASLLWDHRTQEP